MTVTEDRTVLEVHAPPVAVAFASRHSVVKTVDEEGGRVVTSEVKEVDTEFVVNVENCVSVAVGSQVDMAAQFQSVGSSVQN